MVKPPKRKSAPKKPESERWSSGKATENIRNCANSDFSLLWTRHAEERLFERDLIISDVLHILKRGFVYEEGEATSRNGFFKYKMECTTPNSHNRIVRIVVIPSPSKIKILTVMWADEK
jgi:hypothetical protein